MCKIRQSAALFTIIFYLESPASTAVKETKSEETSQPGQGPAMLWQFPGDIATRNLFYGAGGEAHQPTTTVTFQKESMQGSNPKFDVVDQNGRKWKVKLGEEARPETVASRFVWAAGYLVAEDYLVPVLRVKDMPRLRRGRKWVLPDGTVNNVRLKRQPDDQKKIGTWAWADNPFSGSRALNGLRVLMAVINNWDLKDENNEIYQMRGERPQQLYEVSDLGSSFGTVGFGWTKRGSKGNLKAYEHSKFVQRVATEYVNFYVPARPALDHYPDIPEVLRRRRLSWIGKGIPREDARWMGDLLGRLSAQQIRDAFRAGHYAPPDVEGFSRVVEARIAELRSL